MFRTTSRLSHWVVLFAAATFGQTLDATPVATPTILRSEPAMGTFASVQVGAFAEFEMSDTTAGARIHYSLNGEAPSETDARLPVSGKVRVNRNGVTLKVRAWKDGMEPSGIASVT